MNIAFRIAEKEDLEQIWEILKRAIARRKSEGSTQWQDGYPNPAVIQQDLQNQAGYVLTDGDTVVGYCAVLINGEPAYAALRGKWLTGGDFVVYHRVALAESYTGKGLAQQMLRYIEDFALSRGISSVRADTNYDNAAMLKILDRLGYVYCGEVSFRGSARRAFEKVLSL